MAATKHISYTFQRLRVGSVLNLMFSTVSELICENFVTKILTLAQKTTEMRGRESSVALHYPCPADSMGPRFELNPIDIFTHLHFLAITSSMIREIY